jgi:hypothetical protein
LEVSSDSALAKVLNFFASLATSLVGVSELGWYFNFTLLIGTVMYIYYLDLCMGPSAGGSSRSVILDPRRGGFPPKIVRLRFQTVWNVRP